MKSMHEEFGGASAQGAHTVATTPDGLVAMGNLDLMRRYVLLAGDRADEARDALFLAASRGLATMPGQNVHWVTAFAWPLAVTWRSHTRFNSSAALGRSSTGPLIERFRSIWLRALGGGKGIRVCPFLTFCHIDLLLGLSPLMVKRCVQHGVSVFDGGSKSGPWTFEGRNPPQQMELEPNVPGVFVLGCFVAWDYYQPCPVPVWQAGLQRELEELSSGFFGKKDDASPRVVSAPAPMLLDKAVDAGHGLLMSESARYALLSERPMTVLARPHPGTDWLTLTTLFGDLEEDDSVIEHQATFDAFWRPAGHISQLQQRIEAVRAPSGTEGRASSSHGARNLGMPH